MVEPIVGSLPEAVVDLTEKALIRVLHVDDEAGFLKTAKQILEMQGPFEVETASSVEEAQEKMKGRTFDAIVCDYMMPEKDGLEFLKELRDSENNITFIIFTGKGREEVAVKALNLGADRYFSKIGKPETVYAELAHGIRQVMEKKKAEEALHQEREMLETVTQNIGAGLTIISKDYHILWANKLIKETYGDVKGKVCYETYHQRTHVCPGCGVQEIFETGKKHVVHEQVVSGFDGQNVWLELTATPIRDENGNTTAVLELVVPITKRKKAEESLNRIMEELAVTNEKLGVVGKLTRHDVRNKLSAVLGNIYLAKQTLTDDHEALKYLGDIESTCNQVEKIFEFASMYEQLGTEKLSHMDVSRSVDEAVMLFSDLHGAKVVNDCHGLTVLADSLLRQLFYNLIDNSLKHGEKVSQIRMYYEKVGKDHLKLVYEDDGVGIPKAEKEKIFKEGYGKGTGYGLYLIRKMCEVYGWAIRETGKQGKGAQFTITIPKPNENKKTTYRLH